MATVLRPVAQFGEFLRSARERRGLTLQQIAQSTKIPWRHLDAMERGDLAAVPEGLYRRAEVRAYAQAVGLDQNVALAHLMEAQGNEHAAPVAPQVEAIEAPRGGLLATVALVVVIAALGGLLARPRLGAPSSEPSPSVSPPASAATAPPTSAPPRRTSEPERERPTSTSAAAAVPAAPDAMPAPSVVSSSLIVTSEPSGARVVVDGIGRGSTPVTIEYMAFGEKHVRVLLDGYRSEERTVRLTASQPATTLHVELQTTH